MTGQMDSLRTASSDEPVTGLANGDFEQLLEPGKAAAWYYLRQASLAEGGPTSGSRRYLSFASQVAGGAQALQAIGVDGRRASELIVTLWVKADGIAPDKSDPQGGGTLAINFCDDGQQPLGQQVAGRWRGTFDWKQTTARIRVPANARVGIVAVGLLGATGRLSCDDIDIRMAPTRSAGSRR
jgi:hypothetical protein